MGSPRQDLLRYLKMLRDCHAHNLNMDNNAAGFHYMGPADLLLQRGRWYEPPTTVMRYKYALPHACFRNAAMVALDNGLRYVEGYATGVIPVHHAWCVDAKGNVIETTWSKVGIAYFGIQFPPRFAVKAHQMWILRYKASQEPGDLLSTNGTSIVSSFQFRHLVILIFYRQSSEQRRRVMGSYHGMCSSRFLICVSVEQRGCGGYLCNSLPSHLCVLWD